MQNISSPPIQYDYWQSAAFTFKSINHTDSFIKAYSPYLYFKGDKWGVYNKDSKIKSSFAVVGAFLLGLASRIFLGIAIAFRSIFLLSKGIAQGTQASFFSLEKKFFSGMKKLSSLMQRAQRPVDAKHISEKVKDNKTKEVVIKPSSTEPLAKPSDSSSVIENQNTILDQKANPLSQDPSEKEILKEIQTTDEESSKKAHSPSLSRSASPVIFGTSAALEPSNFVENATEQQKEKQIIELFDGFLELSHLDGVGDETLSSAQKIIEKDRSSQEFSFLIQKKKKNKKTPATPEEKEHNKARDLAASARTTFKKYHDGLDTTKKIIGKFPSEVVTLEKSDLSKCYNLYIQAKKPQTSLTVVENPLRSKRASGH